MSAKSPVL